MGASILLGTAATAATKGVAATAATSGLFGAGGSFAAGQTLLTVGTGLSGLTGFMSANDQANALEAEAAEKQRAGILAEAAEREDNKRKLSSMRAKYGASGVKLEGTPLEVLEESAATGEANALALRYGGASSASSRRAGAGALRVTGGMSAGTSLLKGGAEIFG